VKPSRHGGYHDGMERFAAFALLLVAVPAFAHTLPKSQFDRIVEVRLEPAAVNVRYVLVQSEDTMVLDGLTFLTDDVLSALRQPRETFLKWYAETKAKRISGYLFGQIDGVAVTWTVAKVAVSDLDHNKRFEFHFRATFPPASAGSHTFEFRDDTEYVGPDGKSVSDDVDGPVTLSIRERQPKDFVEFDAEEPTKLHGKPRSELKPGEEAKRRTGRVTYRLTDAAMASSAPAAEPSAPVIEIAPEERGLPEQLHERGLKALLDSSLGLVALLGLAAVFGAAHAFTPGHGKTMVAAYLVGEHGTAWHAVVLGFTATLAHTGSVIAIAVGLYAFYGNTPPAAAQGWLMLGGGALIFFVGLWLLMQRLRGKADHVHLFGSDHHHHHGVDGHDHHHAPAEMPKSRFGWVRVLLLGLGGGIIPCWDAVMMLLVAMAQGRLGLAIPLLVAFGAGLASVMIALGLAVVYAHRRGRGSFGESRWFRWLPAISAGILVLVGVWFLRDGLQLLGELNR